MNSLIGDERPDGTVRAIYCHHGGSISEVGRILLLHYQDSGRIHRLLSLGALSSLGSKLEGDGRDSCIPGNAGLQAETYESVDAFREASQWRVSFLKRPEGWMVEVAPGGGFKPLTMHSVVKELMDWPLINSPERISNFTLVFQLELCDPNPTVQWLALIFSLHLRPLFECYIPPADAEAGIQQLLAEGAELSPAAIRVIKDLENAGICTFSGEYQLARPGCCTTIMIDFKLPSGQHLIAEGREDGTVHVWDPLDPASSIGSKSILHAGSSVTGLLWTGEYIVATSIGGRVMSALPTASSVDEARCIAELEEDVYSDSEMIWTGEQLLIMEAYHGDIYIVNPGAKRSSEAVSIVSEEFWDDWEDKGYDSHAFVGMSFVNGWVIGEMYNDGPDLAIELEKAPAGIPKCVGTDIDLFEIRGGDQSIATVDSDLDPEQAGKQSLKDRIEIYFDEVLKEGESNTSQYEMRIHSILDVGEHVAVAMTDGTVFAIRSDFEPVAVPRKIIQPESDRLIEDLFWTGSQVIAKYKNGPRRLPGGQLISAPPSATSEKDQKEILWALGSLDQILLVGDYLIAIGSANECWNEDDEMPPPGTIAAFAEERQTTVQLVEADYLEGSVWLANTVTPSEENAPLVLSTYVGITATKFAGGHLFVTTRDERLYCIDPTLPPHQALARLR